jgi:hypothetical protein
MTKQIEIEHKFELDSLHKCDIERAVLSEGFIKTGTIEQKDYFVSFSKTDLGWDFLRIRYEEGKIYKTDKKWELKDGRHLRVEEESVMSENEAVALIKTETPLLIKERVIYEGYIQGTPAKVVIDSIVLNGEVRYFVEAEIVTNDIALYDEMNNKVLNFMQNKLRLGGKEAPSMFGMLADSLGIR